MSAYGNVPKDDVEAVRAALAHATRLSGELPIGAPAEWRDAAFEAILEGLLNDWVANGTTELEPDDLDDLSNLIRLACDTAMSADLPVRTTAFRCLIRGVMADWVENWNSDDE